MVKTNNLREFIKKNLERVCQRVFFERAAADASFPYIVFSFRTIDNNDLNRSDIYMDVDVWDEQKNAAELESLCDCIEDMFHCKNEPLDLNLPTFYNISRLAVEDENKRIKHRTIEFLIQNYVKG